MGRQAQNLPLAESFLVLIILAAYSWPASTFTHLRTTEKAPLEDREQHDVERGLRPISPGYQEFYRCAVQEGSRSLESPIAQGLLHSIGSGRSREGPRSLASCNMSLLGSIKVRSPSYKTLEAWSENHRI